jgi:hypothetical protein
MLADNVFTGKEYVVDGSEATQASERRSSPAPAASIPLSMSTSERQIPDQKYYV